MWPERTTIQTRWQQLLLAAAKARDDASGKLVHLPNRRPSSVPPAPLQDGALEMEPRAPETEPAPPPAEQKMKPDSVPPPPSSVQQAVRIDPTGRVLSIVGDDGEFSGLVAYATRLAGLVGEAFGLDRFKALDLGLAASRCVMYVEDKGSVVAVRAKNDVELSAVLRRAGL